MRPPKKVRLYDSKAWLYNELTNKKKSPEQIASEQGVDPVTIRRAATKHGIRIVSW